MMKSIGTMTTTRRMMKRSIVSVSELFSHLRHTVIPLGRIALEVNPFPRMQSHRVRVHAFDVRLLQPTRTAHRQRDPRLHIEQKSLSFGQKLVALLMIDCAISLVEQGHVFRVPPAG